MPNIITTPVQEVCLSRRGSCAGCPEGALISSTCMVRFSEPIAQQLGLPTLRAHKTNCRKPYESKTIDRIKVCESCGGSFQAYHRNTKNCRTCLDARKDRRYAS